MAVKVDFLGPIKASSNTLVATITGVEKSRFTAWIKGVPGETSGSATLTCGLLIQQPDGSWTYEMETNTVVFVQAAETEISLALDCHTYDNCELSLQVTGNVYVTAAGIRDYRRRDLPDYDKDTLKRGGINFAIERLVPKYLLGDKNGYALAKAIERAFQLVADGAQYGIDIIQDPWKMPEWRLDELAGELGCLYDYNGTIDQKRYWIINATYLYKAYGTKQAILNFLDGYFQNVEVEENWEYGGYPYHFRVTVSGTSYDQAKISWAQKAIMAVKNVRSVLDSVAIDSSGEIVVTADTAYYYVPYLYAAEDELTNANDIDDWEPMPMDPGLADVALTDEDVTG